MTLRSLAIGLQSIHMHPTGVDATGNGLEKTMMEGMVARKRSRGKPRQRRDKYITDTFGTMTAASWHRFRRDIWAATS